jgi:hypothetical protein
VKAQPFYTFKMARDMFQTPIKKEIRRKLVEEKT